MSDYISVSSAAKMAQCSQSTVRRWLNESLIPQAKKTDKGWKIERSQFHQFLITNGRARATNEEPSKQSDHLRLLHEQLKKAQEKCDFLEKENRQLNAEIKAILGHKAGLNLKGVLSRWVRT